MNTSKVFIVVATILLLSVSISAFETDKASYKNSEKIVISLTDEEVTSAKELVINSGDKYYKLTEGISQKITFTATNPGDYSAKLIMDTEEKTISFTVGTQKNKIVNVLSINKLEFNIEEKVTIYVDAEQGELTIIAPDAKYKLVHEATGNIQFKPKTTGIHKVQYVGETGISEIEFTVVDLGIEVPEPKPSKKIVTIDETKELVIGFDKNTVKKVKFNEIKDDRKNIIIERIKDEIFEINPNQIQFKTVEITKIARGTELRKCTAWNPAAKVCEGYWEKIKDIIPGEEYIFSVENEIGGYAEFGVATINTKKPMYHPGETAEIIMVVLDNQGYLVNAYVTLKITTPNNTTYNYSTKSSISKKETGIYEAKFNKTSLEGNYQIKVGALGENVNQSMISFFTVKNQFEFDIIRDAPVTIDPRMPFTSSIKIIPLTNITNYNFTEVLPATFTVLDKGGATITERNNKQYLEWQNLNDSSTISYIADAPNIIPNVEILGQAIVNYANGEFFEAREWFMAIDPFVNITIINESFESTAPLYYNGDWSRDTVAYDRNTNAAVCGNAGAHGDGNIAATEYIYLDAGLVDLSDAVSAEVEFWWRCDAGFDPTDYFSYDEYYSGGWNDDVFSYDMGGCTGNDWSFYSRTLPGAALQSDFRVRFAVEANANREDWYLDCFTIKKEIFNKTLPTHSTPLLTSTSGTNSTDEKLTCYNQSTTDADGYSVKNIYNWYKNSNPIYLINTPFEGGSNSTYTKDYSGNSNDGIVNGANWSNTSGYDGKGGYYFDGDNDWVSYGDIDELDQADYFTIAMWFNRDVDNSGGAVDTNHAINNVLVAQSSNAANDNFELGTEGNNVEMYFDASANYALTYNAGIIDDTWYHLAVTFNSTDLAGEVRLYINGLEVNSWSDTTTNLDNSATSPLTLGIARIDANFWGDFEGYIDDVFISNTSLGANQIWELYQNNSHIIVSEETVLNDVWMCEVTPNNLYADGSTLNSENLTIVETPPLIQNTQCMVASSWINCDMITYSNQLEKVRTNCTSQVGGSVNNVTFILTNVDDSYTYFNNTVTSLTGGYWETDFADFTIYDSGTFNLNTVCRENPTSTEDTTWSISFGTLSSQLISHTVATTIKQNVFTNFITRTSCTGGECGNVNASVLVNTTSLNNYDQHFTGFEADGTAPWDGWVDGGIDSIRTNAVADYCSDSTCPGAGSWSVEVQDNSATSYTYQSFNLLNVCGGSSCDSINFSLYVYPNSYDNANEGFDVWCDYGTGSAVEIGTWFEDGDTCYDIGGATACENSWTKIEFDLMAEGCTIDAAVELRITSDDFSSGNNNDQVYLDGMSLIGYKTEVSYDLVSTTSGTIPFYTSNNNPLSVSDYSCLENMTNGSSCDTTWNINATGALGVAGEFLASYEPINYSANVNETNTSKVNLTIAEGNAPLLQNTECQVSSSWINCNTISFGDSLESVRTNCTSTGGNPITNVTFNLSNTEDSKNMFFGSDTTAVSGIYEYDFTDFSILDSGNFTLDIQCLGDTTVTEQTAWEINWGTLTVTLIDPSTNSNVTQNQFFDFTSRISCVGGECGDLKASLDPIGNVNSGGVVGTSFSFDIGTAGRDRLVAIFADDESSGTSLTGVSVDGKVCNLVTIADNSAGVGNHQELWYCDEDDLGASSGSVTIAITGGNTGWGIHAHLYENVSQDGPYNYSIDDTSAGIATITVNNVDVTADGLVIAGWGEGTGGLSISTQTSPLATLLDGPDASSTDLFTSYGIESSAQSSKTYSVTLSGAHNRATGIVASWEEAVIGGTKGLIPMNSGTPFYTTTANPRYKQNTSCLGNMTAGETCDTTWSVNSTGIINSTWEFFVIYETLNYSTQVFPKNTSIINITIIDNQAPVASSVSVSPVLPVFSEDLICSFTVTDANPGETLTATVYWYNTGNLSYTTLESVSDGVEKNSTLDSGNTTAGEVWNCGVVPYDQKSYGVEVNSSNVTILASLPPVISNIECQEFGLLWGSCTNLKYNDAFSAVRATCTDPDGNVTQVNFTFSNQEDSYTYFSSNYSTTASDVYTYDNSDVDILDSGNFDIQVSCTDNASITATNTVSWLVPWGSLVPTLISPNSNINVTQNSFFNFTGQVSCTGGECGYINATLDPTPSWWNGHYRYRKQINVTNNEGSALQTGYTMNITINTTGSKFQNDGNDLRVLWLNGATWVELDRINETNNFNNETTEIWFKLQAAINSGATDTDYYIYYGAPTVSTPPVNRSNIYLYYDDFNRANIGDITSETAYSQTGGGTWSINGNKLVNVGAAGDPNKLKIDALGNVNYDVTMLTKINIYSTLGSSSDLWRMGLSSNMDNSGGNGRGYVLLFHQDHSSLDFLNDLRSWGTLGSYNWGVDTWYNMRFRVINPSANSGQGKVWLTTEDEPKAWTIDGNFGGGTVRGYGELGFGGSRQGDTTYFDDILIRYIVANGPSFSEGAEEQYGLIKGIIPMNSGDPFYTITQNPANHTTFSCLGNMKAGDACNQTWVVNATGTINTTWEFFTEYNSLNYSGVSDTTSSIVNITIIENVAPTASNVTILPASPIYSDDLICGYTVTDPSYLDDLSATVSWYLDGVFNYSILQDVTNGVANTNILNSSNTTVGDVWRCGVTPHDQLISGSQVNSTNVTILFNKPPDINSIECTTNNVTWTDCSTLNFNDVLVGVRANCTSEQATITNVTHNLTNIPDSYTFYNGVATSNISDNWSYLQNITLNNSGQYSLQVTCVDNNTDSSISTKLWSLPWGTLGIDLVDPASNGFVERYQYFNFIVNVTCTGGECGESEITLDPISGTSPASGTADSGYVFDNPGNDEEGGSVTQTQTYNGPQGGAGVNFYYIVGEGTTANTALSYINLVYNLTILDINPKDIEALKFTILYCHSGENDVNQDFCNNNVPIEKAADGAQNVEVFNFVTDSWVDIGDITVNADEDMYNESYVATGTLSEYLNSSNEVLVRYEADFSDTGGDGFLAIDYATLTVNYTKLKRGAVSTIVGDTPFYTTDANPLTSVTDSCLTQMIEGSVPCQVQWQVNATGVLGSTHDFFIIYNMTTNQAYVSDGTSAHVNLTIQDSSSIPPTVTLDYPVTTAITNYSVTNFSCSATDAIGLQNMSLYANFTGTWVFNESNTLSGVSDTKIFTKMLEEGKYNWNCVAYDTDTNYDWGDSNRTLTVDLTAPNITLSHPNNEDSFSDSNIDFNFTAYDNFDTGISCNLTVNNIVESSTVASNGVLTTLGATLGQGVHYWNVTCFDDAGNYNTSTTRNFTISDVGPTVNLITADNIVQSSRDIDLQYLPSDNNGITISRLILNGLENDTDIAVENAVINEFILEGLEEGVYTWTVNVSDVSNLTAQATARTFTIDYTPPNINLSRPYDTEHTNLSSLEFNFTVIDTYDSSLVCNITLDGIVVDPNFAATNNTLTGRTISGIGDGIHYWNVTCMDNAGNYNTSETWMLNATSPPTVVLTAPDINYTYDTGETITLNYTPTDNGNFSSCVLIVNDVLNQTNATTIVNGGNNVFELVDVEEGEYNWTVSCTDSIGLNGTGSPNRTFYVDTTKPTLVLYQPFDGSVLSDSKVVFNFTTADNLDPILSCDLVLDSQLNITGIPALSNQVTNFTVTMDTEGIHWWNLTCYDNAGNYNRSETRNFTLLTPPTVTLNDPDDNALLNYSQNIEFRYQPFDGSALNKTELIINGVVNQTDKTPLNGAFNSFYLNFSEDGVYLWTVNATDDVGLVGTATPRTLTIDTSDPNITILAPTEGQVVTVNNVSFNFTVEDNLDTAIACLIYVDGVNEWNDTVTSGGTSVNSKLLYDGSYNWTVTCLDNVNNTVTIHTNFTVDAPPTITLNKPEDGYRTKSGFLYFNYTPIDDIGFENCSLYIDNVWNKSDTNINPGQVNTFNSSGLTEGDHNWTVGCFDETPDFNEVTATPFNFTIDNTGPNITLNFPAEAQTLNNNNVTFNWTATDAIGVLLSCNLTLDGTLNTTGVDAISGSYFTTTVNNLADGPHNWTISCADDLGNLGNSELGNFTINSPDLQINNSGITFSNSNPDLGENITIYANVTNTGGTPASNIIVEFWNGTRGVGTFIGNSTRSLAVNESALFNATWIILSGYHNINVYADPTDQIFELNESNNNASANISVLHAIIDLPANNSLFASTPRALNFTMYDYTGGLINYAIYNYAAAQNSGQGTDGIQVDEIMSLSEGENQIYVQATDLPLRQKNSLLYTYFLDTTPPLIKFNTINLTWFNTSSFNISFNISDHQDSNIFYDIYINTIYNRTYNHSNNSVVDEPFNLSDGKYNITIEPIDNANNTENYTITVYVDTELPNVNLLEPPNNQDILITNITLNYTVTDNLDNILSCNLYLDSNLLDSTSVTNGGNGSYPTGTLTEGLHQWNATCTDEATNLGISETWNFSVFVAPEINLTTPYNDFNTSTTSITFYFNVSDDTGLQNCSLLLGGGINSTKTGAQLANNAENNFSVSSLEGFHTWQVECYDNTAQNMYTLSSSRNITVDTLAPTPNILTVNETWFNVPPFIDFNITDDYSDNLSYRLFANDVFNTNGTVLNNTNSQDTLVGLTNGTYTIILEGKDIVNNSANSTKITIYVDTILPNITLHTPENDSNVTTNNVFFNFTIYDNMAPNMTYSFYVDSILRNSSMILNNTLVNETVTLSSGRHWWWVNVTDLAGNTITSMNYTFVIVPPDLVITSGNITINETNPIEGTNVTISARVFNIGDTSTSGITVRFYDGDPDNGGTQINGDIVIATLPAGSNESVNVTHILPVGDNNIFVQVDPPIATNGSIEEENETNNQDNRSFFIGLWHFVRGNTYDNLVVTDNNIISVYEWLVSNSTGSNLFAADSESSITFTNLTAFTRTRGGAFTSNDFQELDGMIGSENFSDSINKTYSIAKLPIATKTFTVINRSITNVPIANSTNNSNFQTGILWDSGDGLNEYNGSQDPLFITEINKNVQGYNSTVDFEIRIPALLREFDLTETTTVYLYTEIK